MPLLHRDRLVPLAAAALLAVPLLLVAEVVAGGIAAEKAYEVRFVPDGRVLAFLPPGPRLTIANAYWLATVQYVGGQHMTKGRYERLYPLVDLVTTLDPAHGYAYQTGGIVLSTAGRIEESDRILRKGIEAGPAWWSYPFYLAFNDYFYRGDYASAARWARQAARTPGASTNISQLALSLEVKSGDPEGGLALVQELLRQTEEEEVREKLLEQERLARLQVAFHRLDGAVARWVERHGRPPPRLEALVEAGLLPALPEEPFGGRFELREDGRVHSTARDFRFKPPEPGRLPAAPTWRPPDFLEPAP